MRLRVAVLSASFVVLLTSTLWAQGLPTVAPEDVGLSSDRLTRLEHVMQA